MTSTPPSRIPVPRLHRVFFVALAVAALLAGLVLGVSVTWADPGTPAPEPSGIPGSVSPQPNPSGPAIPTPTGTSSLPGSPVQTPGAPADPGGSPGFVSSVVIEAVNTWLSTVVRLSARTLLGVFADLGVLTPDVTRLDRVTGFHHTALVVVNAVYVLLIIVGGIIVMSHGTLQSRYEPREIVGRIVVAFILSNVSLWICRYAIDTANAITGAVAGQVAASGIGKSFSGYFLKLLSTPGVLFAVLGLVFLFGVVMVIATLYLRLLLMIFLVAVAPLALACHALPHTETIAVWWWKALAATLGSGLAQGVVMAAAAPILLSRDNDVLSVASSPVLALLSAIALMWLLWQIPLWTLKAVRGSSRSPRFLRFLGVLAIHQGLRHAGRNIRSRLSRQDPDGDGVSRRPVRLRRGRGDGPTEPGAPGRPTGPSGGPRGLRRGGPRRRDPEPDPATMGEVRARRSIVGAPAGRTSGQGPVRRGIRVGSVGDGWPTGPKAPRTRPGTASPPRGRLGRPTPTPNPQGGEKVSLVKPPGSRRSLQAPKTGSSRPRVQGDGVPKPAPPRSAPRVSAPKIPPPTPGK